MQRKFFQIGFNKCGTTFIAKLFQMNGIPTLHWLEGRLAEDIAYSKHVGRKPLLPWADSIIAFTDMESVRYLNMPVTEAFKEFRFLDQSYPGAIFLLNTRNVEDWVISRYMHRNGTYARAYAQILGVDLGDLADIWADAWHDHIADCRSYFAGRPEFIEIDIDHAAPDDYRDALSPWFDLPQCPNRPGKGRKQVRHGYLSKLGRMLNGDRPASGLGDDQRAAVAAELAAIAKPARILPSGGSDAVGSGLYAIFDAATGRATDRQGDMLPLAKGDDGWYRLDPGRLDLLPLASAVNDIAQLVQHGIYHLDMAQRVVYGDGAAPAPFIAPLRRDGAANVFLWPMAWVHRLGNSGYLGNPDRDEPAWRDKLDLAINPADLPADDRTDDLILSHRYIISLNETADFLPLLNSHSVIFRAKSSCEDAISGIFKPWQHYIPLKSAAVDLPERLAWARENPGNCQQISANARALCKLLADPELRRCQLIRILRDYRMATGQE